MRDLPEEEAPINDDDFPTEP